MPRTKSAGKPAAKKKAPAPTGKDQHARKTISQMKREIAQMKVVIGHLCDLMEAQSSVLPNSQRSMAKALVAAAKELD